MRLTKVKLGRIAISIALVISVAVLLSVPLDIIPPLGGLINPFTGIFTVSLTADHPQQATVFAPGYVSAPVYVIRDSWGIPHIYAENDNDLYFAFGYVQAQDRLWQMDMTRRQACGQVSEILGSDFVSTDIFLRSIGMERAAQLTMEILEQSTDTFNQSIIGHMNAYTDGINYFIGTAGQALPLEFKLLNYQPKPWTPLDSLAIGRVMDFMLSWDDIDLRLVNVYDEFNDTKALELFPLIPPLQIPIVPEYGTSYPSPPGDTLALPSEKLPEALLQTFGEITQWSDSIKDPCGILGGLRDAFRGSNNWAVNGTKSDTGNPIFCNDMHLARSVPAIWYQAHLVSGEGLNMYGFLPPGVPVIIAGHNEDLAWGFTNVAADVIDWYYYKVNPSNPNQYWYDGSWRDIVNETTLIPLKGGGVYPHTIRRTIHGPILSDMGFGYKDYVVAQHWSGQDPSYEMIALTKMQRASDYTEFIDGQQWWWTISQNICYADRHGTIAIRPTGHWPIRSSGYGRIPYNGSAGEGEWIGYIPFDELPLSLNPSRGYVASANQLAAMYGSEPGNYPYFIHSHTSPGYRARRINELLSNDDSVTVEDMKSYQLDVVDTMAEAFVPFIIDAFNNAPATISGDATLAAAINYLDNWNYSMLQTLVAPTIWRAWRDFYLEGIYGDEYSATTCGRGALPWPSAVVTENMTRFNPTASWFDNITTTDVTETRDDIILSALQSAVNRLIAEEGADMSGWTWGKFHFVVYDHRAGSALGHGPYSASGSGVTLNPSGCDMWKREDGASTSGASERLIVDFDDPLFALSVIPGGQSGNPLSRHYSDQLHELFLVGDYHTDYLYANMDLLTDRESVLIITG